MKIKSRQAVALITACSFTVLSMSACAGRNVPQPNRTGYPGPGQYSLDNRARLPGTTNRMGYGTGNNIDGLRLGTTPGTTNRYGTGMGTNLGNNINRLGNNLATRLGTTNTAQVSPILLDIQKSDKVRTKLTPMKHIDRVNVVVMGDTALVAYDIPNKGTDMNATRRTVTDTVKKTDTSIKNVYVTESAKINTEVSRIYTNMVDNKPANELKDSFNRLANTLKSTGAAVK